MKDLEIKNFSFRLIRKTNLKINYYEDVFKNKSLLEKDIKLDLEYFGPQHKLRVKGHNITMKEKYTLNEKKNNFLNYNFKQLGDIDILDLLQNLDKIEESDWVTDSIRTRGKTHEKIKTLPIRWTPEVLKQTKLTQIKNNEFYDILNFDKIEPQLLKLYKENYGDGFIHKIILLWWTIKTYGFGPSLMRSIELTFL